MGHRKRHPAAPSGAPRRYESGEVRIDDRVRLGHALASALEAFGLGAAVVDPGTLRFRFVNEALASLLGVTVEELIALPSVLECVVGEDAAAAEACLCGPRPSEATVRLVHASGDAIEVDLSIRPFDRETRESRESRESPTPSAGRALAVVFRGVGERRERESLRAAVGDAAEALRARDELFSLGTHEVRTPITALRLHAHSLIRALERNPPDLARARRAAGEVDRHAERTSVLAERFLDASRIRSGRLEIERSPMDLAEVVRDIATRFGAEAAALGATIIIDGEQTMRGSWDPVRIEQIVMNLISNALKFGEGKAVAVELRSIGKRALLTVRDHGPGIPDEEQERIFEPFERARRARGAPGAGLGLWIVRRLVEAHGGTVRLASALGKGSVFAVDLPKEIPDDAPDERAQPD